MVDVYVLIAYVTYTAHYKKHELDLLRLNALICNQIISNLKTKILLSVSIYLK